MKKVILITIQIMCSLTSKAQYGSACLQKVVVLGEDAICNNNGYVLVFEDDFDGSELDFGKWKLPYQGVERDFTHGQEKQWYANTGNSPFIPYENNIEISNGTLKLIAKKEPVSGTYVTNWETNPPTSKTETIDYTSAEILSKYLFHYGIFEIRCKIPKGKGMFPAFWTYGGPEWNEIDVFEFWNEETAFIYDPNKLSRIHHMNQWHDFDVDGDAENCPEKYFGPDFSDEFHTFTLVWTKQKIEWYVDGDHKRTSPLFHTIEGQQVDCAGVQAGHEYILSKSFPRMPMNIISNLAIQSGSNAPEENIPFIPKMLEIDYIRYYKQIECNELVVLDEEFESTLSQGIFNVVMANRIVANTDFDLGPDEQLALIARDEIDLSPSFFPDFGAEFSAEVRPDICDYSGMVTFNGNEPVGGALGKMKNPSANVGASVGEEFKTDSTNEIFISPNPTTDKSIELKTKQAGDLRDLFVELRDLSGRLVHRSKMGDNLKIEVQELKTGVYILHLFDKNNSVRFTDKVILN